MIDHAGRARRSETFECRWYERWAILAGVFLVLPVMTAIVVGSVLAASTDMLWTPVLFAALFVVVVGYEILYVPSRVTLDDAGVLLRSPCRRVFIPGHDLVEVERLLLFAVMADGRYEGRC